MEDIHDFSSSGPDKGPLSATAGQWPASQSVRHGTVNPAPPPKAERWADMIDDDDFDVELCYDQVSQIWDGKLIPNISRNSAGILRVKLPKEFETIPFVKSLQEAMRDHEMDILWDANVQVRAPPDLIRALKDDGPELATFVDNLFCNIGADSNTRDKTRIEIKILDGLYNLRELRAVMRSFHHKYSGSLEGKPAAADWLLDLRLETMWEIQSGDDRSEIHYIINSTEQKSKVKNALTPLFGEAAASQLVDGYEIAFRYMIRDTYKSCLAGKQSIAQKMRNWFLTNITPRMPTKWALLANGYQTVKQTVPLTSAEKQKMAETKPSWKERQDFLNSKPTKTISKRLIPVIDTSLLTTISGKKASTAWNNALESFSKRNRDIRVDPNRIHHVKQLNSNVTAMRKMTIDISSVFKKHCKGLRDEIFQKLRSERSGNRRNSDKIVITSYEFSSELTKRKPELELKERDLIDSFCTYITAPTPMGIESSDVSTLESTILHYLEARYEALLYSS